MAQGFPIKKQKKKSHNAADSKKIKKKVFVSITWHFLIYQEGKKMTWKYSNNFLWKKNSHFELASCCELSSSEKEKMNRKGKVTSIGKIILTPKIVRYI